jgi:hypothetical protein
MPTDTGTSVGTVLNDSVMSDPGPERSRSDLVRRAAGPEAVPAGNTLIYRVEGQCVQVDLMLTGKIELPPWAFASPIRGRMILSLPTR